MTLYIIENHKEQFLTKSLEWDYGCKAEDLFRTPHKDVALNQLIELNTRDIGLRAHIVDCESDDRGRPVMPARSSESVA
jgi:hypothetical protein